MIIPSNYKGINNIEIKDDLVYVYTNRFINNEGYLEGEYEMYSMDQYIVQVHNRLNILEKLLLDIIDSDTTRSFSDNQLKNHLKYFTSKTEMQNEMEE